MRVEVPRPMSGGLILSYRCSLRCRHCMYACSPEWEQEWMPEEDLGRILEGLAGKIAPSVRGPRNVGLNEGLHFTGGEPFLNFDLLLLAVEAAENIGIPSTFVETNSIWCTNDHDTKERLLLLREKGLKGMLVSVNPFYLEWVPFSRTRRAVEIGLEVFGDNLFVYQTGYYRLFAGMGLEGTLRYEEYKSLETRHEVGSVEFFYMGRAAYRLGDEDVRYSARDLFSHGCVGGFLRPWHNHFDNYGNYVPGYCGGITIGDCRELETLLKKGIDTDEQPVLGYLARDDMAGLLRYAQDFGYHENGRGYLSKCHLCTDIRKYLTAVRPFRELGPVAFYKNL